ncbi:putative leukotriene A-4 hydrolase like protein [Pseudovirgaria hyperparasitica]|uniref:Leukotriene A(4) hydrolase n=1 Tax=Pseudovirgaria hyperparasitica TaxID=470096 RepID=A0A6A6WL95_9PEZI|nr:putative leukotriene A-4 hydrolase like protein [Pseudovirgaria hyperparasitica]KAF2762984.1 putative leukotriene A-4 hydrolase like protein [Pseudovirgaria hyperparasitica]
MATTANVTINAPRDPNTLSNYNAWLTRHTKANFEIDFVKKILRGNVVLSLESLTERESKEIVLDTSYLDIQDVQVAGIQVAWDTKKWTEPYGSPLTISLNEGVGQGESIDVDITLSTTEQCTALQWMEPEQTSNKKHPYMFSQCQAIHARSVYPCQDTPDVKSTFEFNIRSRLPVLASGLATGSKDFAPGKNGESGTLVYSFKQDVPMPSYLFAIASGDLASASIGPRSVVWTGPEELVGCKWEFEGDMDKFLEAAESIVYPYAWGTYNVLVLPASFPYGGMENPIYTFATPTIVSGDKQNIDVIAHELSHSWSGNLVSNASWEHFWLNEGWTTYLERRIQAYIHGEPHRDFSAVIGWKALTDSINDYGEDHEFTKLIVDLKGKDPDDAFSSIPYEKGFIFLYYLEKLIGKSKWDKFIPHYFQTWKYKSVDSYDFKATLLDFFASDKAAAAKLDEVDWDSWFYKPGFPPKPEFDDTLIKSCLELADKWESRSTGKTDFTPAATDIKGWVGNQSVVFLERVQLFPKPLKAGDIELMGQAYSYDKSQNAELVSRYYGIGLQAKAEAVYQPTADFLGRVGRMKFVRPLYKMLNACDRKLAIATFEKNKNFYHPICRSMVEKDLFGKDA